MAKLKHIIRQLSDKDYEAIHASLMDSSAEKSAFLLKVMREHSTADSGIMEELDVNTNAYYTLRSRLNQKIEEYLLQQMESPRTDLLKKVANINELMFTKKKAITVATLKKLEKELLDYDLSNELTIVYKALKKLHIHTEEYTYYTQLYNKHVAYMLAVDKAEDLLAEYFRSYGYYMFSGDQREKSQLVYMTNEMENITKLHPSHRLYVYKACMEIFHRIYVDSGDISDKTREPIEDILDEVDNVFETYYLDSIYHHLEIVFDFLRLSYYNFFKVYRKADKYFDEVNSQTKDFLNFFGLYTFPAQFLSLKIDRNLRMEAEKELYEENQRVFQEFDLDERELPLYINYIMYRAIACYYAGKFDESARWVNNLLNEVSLKKYPYAMLEIKTFLALQYCCKKDFDLFNQLVNSIQRQIRLLGKENCEDIVLFTKILKTSISDTKKEKEQKVRLLIDKFRKVMIERTFRPISTLQMDDKFVEFICGQ